MEWTSPLLTRSLVPCHQVTGVCRSSPQCYLESTQASNHQHFVDQEDMQCHAHCHTWSQNDCGTTSSDNQFPHGGWALSWWQRESCIQICGTHLTQGLCPTGRRWWLYWWALVPWVYFAAGWQNWQKSLCHGWPAELSSVLHHHWWTLAQWPTSGIQK